MKREDHQRTASWGPGGAPYRASQRSLIDQGNFAGAFALDKADLARPAFGGQYAAGVLQAEQAMNQRMAACNAAPPSQGGGATARSGPPGTIITVYATNTLRYTPFYLVAGRNEPGEAHANHSCMDSLQNVNPNVRTSNNRGFIGNTSGPLNRAPGVWQVCFRTLPGDAPYSTLAVLFTVT